jgi:hypothetical protein
VLALMPMQRRLVWPAAWLISVWHVATTVSAEAEAIMTELSMVFPHFLPMNVRTVPWSTDSITKHWQYHEALTNFLISLNL